LIYLDNAATTVKKPQSVIAAVVEAMNSAGNPGRNSFGCSLDAARMIYNARVKIARFFGCCRPDNVVFTANSTEALNIAINGLLNSGDHVITTDLEHNSVLRPLYRLEAEKGVVASFVPADKQGNIDYNAFAEMIRPETMAIICTHASNLTGNMIDLSVVGQIAKKYGLLFIVDASQTAGSQPVDMEKMGIDVLCFTGHKGLMGPQGTGGMCIREGVNIRPWKVGGTGIQSYNRQQPEELPARLEAGTLNSHGIAGLSAAIDYIEETGLENIREKELKLMRRFYEGVKDIDGVTVYGDFSSTCRAAIVALNIRDYDSGAVAAELAEYYGIITRPGAHCAPRMHQALGTKEQGAVRFSFSWFNTEEETDTAIRAVKEIAG